MKKISSIVIILMVTVTYSFSQFTSKGTFLVGGSGSGSFGSTTEKYKFAGQTTTVGKTTSIDFSPAFGYFFIDNAAIGAQVNLSTSKFNADGSNYYYKSNSIALAPFVRYYFNKIYAQGSVQFGSKKDEDNGDGVFINKYGLFGWSFLGGYAIPLNESVMLEPQLGYGSSVVTTKSTNYEDLSGGLFLRIGVYVYLSK